MKDALLHSAILLELISRVYPFHPISNIFVSVVCLFHFKTSEVVISFPSMLLKNGTFKIVNIFIIKMENSLKICLQYSILLINNP